LTLFTDRQTDRSLNWNISTYVIYAILGALIVYFISLWRNAVKHLSRNDKSLLTGVQILLAILIAGIAYVIYSLASNGEASILLNEIPASTFQSLNSFFVVIFAPVFAWLWIKLGRHEPSAPTKMAIGLFLLAVGYLWIAFGVKDVAATTRVSMMWIIGMYALHTWGELCLLADWSFAGKQTGTSQVCIAVDGGLVSGQCGSQQAGRCVKCLVSF
jgi:POT family proton-dependent oligopeptide transporter